MSFKRIVIAAVATVVTVTAGALLFAFNVDLGRFEPQIERFLSQTLHRETRFDSLSLNLGWPTRVTFENLTVANAPWAEKDRPLVRIGRLEGEVDFWSLVNDQPILVERLRTGDITVHLAWNEDGEPNFMLGEPGKEKPKPDGPVRRGAPIVLRDAELQNGLVQLDLPAQSNQLTVELLALDHRPDDSVTLDLKGKVNQEPMGFSGTVGPFSEVMAAGAVDIQGAGNFADLSINGQVNLDNMTRPNRPMIKLDLYGQDIENLERFLGLSGDREGSYSLNIESQESGEYWLVNIDGKVDKASIEAEATMLGIQDLSRGSVDLHARGEDLNTVLSLFGIEEAPTESFEVIGVVSRDMELLKVEDVSLVVGSTALDFSGSMNNFPDYQNSSLKLNVAGPDIGRFRGLFGLPGAAEGPFQIKAELKPDDLGAEVASAVIDNNLGEITFSGRLSREPDFVGSEVSLSIKSDNAQDALQILNLPGLAPIPMALDADLAVGSDGLSLSNGRLTGLYGATLLAEGHIARAALDGTTDLNVQLTGPDLAATLNALGVALPLSRGSFDIQTSLRPTRAGLRLEGLTAKIGESDLKLNGLVPLESNLAGLDLTVDAKGPNLSQVLLAQEMFELPVVPWSLSGHVRRIDQQLRLDNVALQIAETAANGSATGAWPLGTNNWHVDLFTDGPDFSKFVRRIDDFEPGPVPFKLNLTADLTDDKLLLTPAILEIGAARLQLSGEADGLPDLSSTNMKVELDIPDLSELGVWSGEPLPPTSAGFRTTLSGSARRLNFEDLQITTGESLGQGSVSVDFSEEVPRFDIQLQSDSLDFTELLPVADESESDATPAPDSDSPYVFSETPLPFELLERVNGSVDVNIARFVTTDRIVFDIILAMNLENGELELSQYRSSGITGNLAISGAMASLGNGRGTVDLTLDARDLMPAREDWQQADPSTLPNINALLELKATGSSMRELASGLSGKIRAVASEGVMPGRGLGALNALLLDQVLSIILPGAISQSPTTLVCFAGQVIIEDGMATTEPILALRTDKLLLLASGDVNLKNEKLKLSFETTPTKLLGASLTELVNPFVSVEGTLKKPSPTIDATGTIIYGGAAAATAGLSILAKGVWDRLRKATNPCETLREDLLEEEAQNN